MTKNKIQDLRNHLFETIELLKDKEIDINTALAIATVSESIINTAKVEVQYLKAIKSITSSIISELISLSPDAFSLELTNEESIFYTFKKYDYSFYIQQYFETEDDGFNATLVSFKGDNKIDSINGNINSIIESIESKISNNISHNLNLAIINELSY
jgi:hypothetical protein